MSDTVFESEDTERSISEGSSEKSGCSCQGILTAFAQNFMGRSPPWYKAMIIGSMFLNILLRFTAGTQATAWAVLLEFIFTLAMATHCYPLQPGGLIVIEAYALGLATPHALEHEVEVNIDILLLVTFMVACVHFLKNLLLLIFTNLLLKLESKVVLSVALLITAAIMSAFLDALSVAAVLISVCTGVLDIYYHAVRGVHLVHTSDGHAAPDFDVDGQHHDTMAFELVPHHHEDHLKAAKVTVSV